LMQILSIFLKLQAVKQSGPDFFGLPGMGAENAGSSICRTICDGG